ncbi:alanine racemase [Paeniglutamicibacter psychrophenolicus]|uniref:Alanine racemase n=1 Tax=Paeniglutamicibacter psychrophenolicus TaxID=257454 RepID=A0ABS4W8A7_9MICC|nr:alanine racemase [Paeniglutamicibacter psychrophenolicus]MBP2372251.1 alanine racemase [Paeniglutamicibacter psychrophenolicus]
MNRSSTLKNTAASAYRNAEGFVPQRAAYIETAAITANVRALREVAKGAKLLAVLKADGYGHGIVPAARAAVEGGADYLGTAVLEEAFAVRAAGITAPLFSWLSAPGAPYGRAITEDIELAAYSLGQLREIAEAGQLVGVVPRIHLKIDTGMWRGGATLEDWPGLCAAARELEAEGKVRVLGIWSHLACADEPGHASVPAQLEVFRQAIATARALGLDPVLCHIANSAATLAGPEAHFDMVRPGLAVYGVNPLAEGDRGNAPALRPAMSLGAAVVQTKRAPAGAGVSYGHTESTERETTLAVVPLGYADGVFRSASSAGPVLIGKRTYRVLGRVCMDQFVLDVGDDDVAAGDAVLLFGPGDSGEPHVEAWAAAAGTIPYEVLTRIGSRVPRIYL